jgi:hypothetical protein
MYEYCFRSNVFSALNLSISHTDWGLTSEYPVFVDTDSTKNDSLINVPKEETYFDYMQLYTTVSYEILLNFVFLKYLKKTKKHLVINKNCYKINYLFKKFNGDFLTKKHKALIVSFSNYSLAMFGRKNIYELKSLVRQQYTSYLRTFFEEYSQFGDYPKNNEISTHKKISWKT